MQIIPAILPKDYMELVDKFDTLKDYSSLVQIDFCDGDVGLQKTYIPKLSDPLAFLSTHHVQCDLMVREWKTLLPILAKQFSLHSIVIHLLKYDEESIRSVSEWTLDEGIGLGFSLRNDQDLLVLYSAYELARTINPHVFVQCMGIRTIGKQGEPYDDAVEQRIREIRKRYPDIYIQVDGSMAPEYATRVKNAGADAAVVGSYLFSKPTYECFEDYSQIV